MHHNLAQKTLFRYAWQLIVMYYTAGMTNYLGVFITACHKFCCSLSNAKKSFYRAFNCVFGKVGRVASENVIVELLTKGQSNLTKSASRGAHSPVRGHPRGSKVPLNSWRRVSY